ncbi:uncharacterized protein LOC126790878 [Argentina anserina]|uniref:uncharacterized protein LOC126790878 n=1 Tax=Argentina anserina TaxID=57926 RepID=UPI0021762459|nr:uncharacterized protein LOC126790878 [Potentilla anserina]
MDCMSTYVRYGRGSVVDVCHMFIAIQLHSIGARILHQALVWVSDQSRNGWLIETKERRLKTRSLGRSNNQFLLDLLKDFIAKYEDIRDAKALSWKQKSKDRWLSDEDRNTIDGMRRIAKEFFQNLFVAAPYHDLRIIIPHLFPDTTSDDIHMMSIPIIEQYIHDALFKIRKLKAPSVDGFPALFYQQHWKLCAPEIISTVTNLFSSGNVPSSLNHTLITLVPKVSAPHDMHLFRHISLCCTVYKIISKIIVDRVRPMLKKWISPNHASFVTRRQISDNIMIAQEILHKCKTSQGKKGFMAWKVDISKGYDKISWSFIEQVLYEVKIPTNLVKIIMSCVTTASYQVIINGELSDSFIGSRGIRNGDPLSPHLFVLCMEKLSHVIHSAQTLVMKKCMDLLCNLSDQSISFEKSMLYCSPNVSYALAKDISVICGMPLIHSRVNASTYVGLVDKVQSRLASWKCKSLNMAGRLTLIQAITSSTPKPPQTTPILVKSELLQRDSDEELRRPIRARKPSYLGNFRVVEAVLGAAAARLEVEDSDAALLSFLGFIELIRGCLEGRKYDRRDNGEIWDFYRFTFTYLLIDVMRIFRRLGVAAGAVHWILISAEILHIIPGREPNPSMFCDSSDKIIWRGTTFGIFFFVKSAYQVMCEDRNFQKYPWLKILSLNIPPKLKIFLWTFVSSKILTNVQRFKRKLTGNPSCIHCNDILETMIHLFRDCPKAMLVWKSFNISTNMLSTFSLNWEDWLYANLMQNDCHINNLNWNVFFVFCR